MKLLETQKNKLASLEKELDELIANNPTNGHGGTPFITDNSKGKAMKKYFEKYRDRIHNKITAIHAQKEKIEKTERLIAYRTTQTKKSAKFIEKNPVSEILPKMEQDGKVKQWLKNPQYYFVIGLEKVALCTFGDKVGVSKKYMAKTKEDFEYCKNLISEYLK